jgi:hypothetical protein
LGELAQHPTSGVPMLQEVTAPFPDSTRPSDLTDWLGSHGQPVAADALGVVTKITVALAELHAQGYAHGGLCPACIHVASDGARGCQ